jgi:hypothetical protein
VYKKQKKKQKNKKQKYNNLLTYRGAVKTKNNKNGNSN